MAMPAAGRKRKRKRTFATKRKLFVGQRVEVIQCRFCFTFINAFFLIDCNTWVVIFLGLFSFGCLLFLFFMDTQMSFQS